MSEREARVAILSALGGGKRFSTTKALVDAINKNGPKNLTVDVAEKAVRSLRADNKVVTIYGDIRLLPSKR